VIDRTSGQAIGEHLFFLLLVETALGDLLRRHFNQRKCVWASQKYLRAGGTLTKAMNMSGCVTSCDDTIYAYEVTLVNSQPDLRQT
jgi:hypothetical protein